MDEKKTPEAGGVTPVIELGGRIWSLKVTHSVLQKFSALTRCNLMQIQVMMGRYDMMSLMLWLILAQSQKDLKRETVDEWLNELPAMQAMEIVMTRCADAFEAAFPKAEPTDDEAGEDENGEEPTDPTV